MRGEDFSSKVEDLITHFVVACDDKASVDVANSGMYGERCGAAVDLFKFRGCYIITCAQKSQKFVADDTVPVTVVPHKFSQAPVFLAHRMRRKSVTLRSANISLSLESLLSSRIYCSSCLYFLSARS